MRFKRSDLPGLAIAVVGPVLLFMLLVAAYELWDHHGSPLLGMLSVNIAVGGGLIGAFSRFIRNWSTILLLLGVIVACVFGVVIMQRTDNDGTILAAALKVTGVLVFGLLNVALIWQLLSNGLNPVLVRRDERLAAAAEEQG